MNDPWLTTLATNYLDYFKLKDLMENGPRVKARLHKVNLRWCVRIEEDWEESDGENYYTATYSNLDKRCEWANEQLKSWKFVTRLSHQEWKFFNKRQAEKFVTLYNLVWAE